MEQPLSENTNYGQNLRKWASKIHPFISHFALTCVAQASNFNIMVKALHDANTQVTFSRNDIAEWLSICKKSKQILRYILTVLPSDLGISSPFLDFKPMKIAVRAAYSNKPHQAQRLIKKSQTLTESDLQKMAEDFTKELGENVDLLITVLTSPQKITSIKDSKDNTLSLIEFFIYNNFILCLTEYNEYFPNLYRKARLGDYDAIIKLIRIDPIIIHDKHINFHYIKAKPEIASKLKAAYDNPLKYHTKASKVKVSTAGLISAFTEAHTGKILKPSDIWELFDAFAKDVEHSPEDEDLPIEPEAFRKAVKRHHNLWLPLLNANPQPLP